MTGWNRALGASALCIAIAVVGCGGSAAADNTSMPAWQSESAKRLSPAIKTTIDKLFSPLVTSGELAGVVVGVVDGNNRWVLGYGRKSLANDTPPNSDTLYEIGSVTKVFTAIALAALIDRRRVNPSDPVAKYLPGFVRVPAYKGKKIALEHLAVHTSGLPRMPGDFVETTLWANDYPVYGIDRTYGFLAKCRLKSAPGTKCEYSNLGMGLLGLALSRANSTSYEKMVRDVVIRPLGLEDTAITLSPNQRARLAPGYCPRRSADGTGTKILPAPNWTFKDNFAGAGALRSTAKDMLDFVAANLGVSQTPLNRVLRSTHEARFKEGDESSTGLGWQILSIANGEPKIIWHDGGTGGYSAFIGFCKERNVGVVALANTYSESGVDKAALQLMVVLMHPELLQ